MTEPGIHWNFDIEAAKSEGWILICVDNEKRWVGLSCWLPDQKRWNMIGAEQVPHAWVPVTHPLSDTPFVKPMGMNTDDRPPVKARKTASEAFRKPSVPVAALPPGMNVTLPPGMNVTLPPGVG